MGSGKVLVVGIIQPINALRALDAIGCAEACMAVGFPAAAWDSMYDVDGNFLRHMPGARIEGSDLPPLNGLTRPQLHEILTNKALEVGADIHYSTKPSSTTATRSRSRTWTARLITSTSWSGRTGAVPGPRLRARRAANGIEHERVEKPHQGPTLQFRDAVGTHLEPTSSMDLVPRKMQNFHEFVAGAPQRIDHYQVVTHDVQAATDSWTGLGMRMAEYTAKDGTDELWGTWMEVKGNTHDLVFTNGQGPRLHHFAYTVPDATALLHAADVAGALGFGEEIDRGPGRHGISSALFPVPARPGPAPHRAVHHALPIHRPGRGAHEMGHQQPQALPAVGHACLAPLVLRCQRVPERARARAAAAREPRNA
ncbi:MAG: 3,4-dihydroxyphenylacetate 2,3-dioxygenase [Cryobacterium sp.]|nr:3,4-dihydroxyphenylacetate 2,3-dioxygenase [Cryobacterium sp.]